MYKNLKVSPVIVLEGPDGCGKSTLSEEFVKSNWNYAHFGAPDGPAYDFYRMGINNIVGPTVLDRFHSGSIVYGSIFRGTSDLTDFQHWLIEMELKSVSALMVHVTVPWEQQLKTITERRKTTDGDQFEALDKQRAIREKYDEVMASTALRRVTFDWTRGDTAQRLFDVAVKPLFAELVDRPDVMSSVPSLGWWRAPYVLVGDEPRSASNFYEAYKRHGVPLRRLSDIGGAPFNSTSGEYLYGALTSAGIQNDVCIFNSRLLDGREVKDIFQRWEFPGTTIALGKRASERLEATGVDHVMVPHPQYIRRFHHKDIELYGSMIRDARIESGVSLTGKAVSANS